MARVPAPEVQARVDAFHAKRAADERARQRRQDAALLKLCIDGPDDLDWAAIFASIDPEKEP